MGIVAAVACGGSPSDEPSSSDGGGGSSSSSTAQGGADGGAGGAVGGAGGDGGDGGSAGGAPPSGNSPLPDDAALFGQKVMAMYIFRAPYVMTTGDPPVITTVVNAHDPGTHDAIFDAGHRPFWIEDCGQDAGGQSYGCARFDADLEHYGIASGFSIGIGDRPSMLVVMKMNALDLQVSIPFQIAHDTQSTFMNTPEVRSAQGLWRYNGHFTDTPHNVDFGSPDLAIHLHEQHQMSPDRVAIFDGVVQGTVSGDAGVSNPLNIVSLGRRAPFEYSSVDMFEAIVVDEPTLGEADAYRTLRAAPEYPTLPL